MKRAFLWALALTGVAFAGLAISWLFAMPDRDTRRVWVTEGYGLVLDIGPVLTTAYEVSNVSCRIFADMPSHSGLLRWLGGAELTRNGDVLTLEVAGTVNPIIARPGTVPPQCPGPTPGRQANAGQVFDVAWETMHEHYSFFDLHNVDWESRRALRPDETATNGDLYDSLTQMLTGLDDGHTYIASTLGTFSPSVSGPEWDTEVTTVWSDLIAQHGLDLVPDTGLAFGLLEDGTGYILMRHMDVDAGLLTSRTALATQAMAHAATALAEAPALIIDLRYNPGGSDDISLAYAAFLTDQPVTAFTKITRDGDGWTEPYVASVTPSVGPHLTQPTVVLTSRYTASAAEIFTMATMDMPQVTRIGQPTSGGLSDIMEITLPNDWFLGFSHQRYSAPDGVDYEWIGIPPDIEATVDPDATEDETLAAARDHLQGR